MRIAVNARFLGYHYQEGYGNFIREIGLRMARANPNDDYIFIFDGKPAEEKLFPSNIQMVTAGPPARHPLLWKYWYDYRIPSLLQRNKADVFLSADGFCSLRTTVPQCLVIHDLAFLHFPEYIPASYRWFYKRYTPRFLKKAKQIVTVSAFSKQDLIRQYDIPDEKIRIVYNAANPLFQPIDHTTREAIKAKYAKGKEFFLFVGAIHPRKNILHLLKAFSWFKKWQQSNMQLVIVGRLAWQYKDLLEALQTFRYREDVNMTGYLPMEELAQVMAASYALVYPSYFEGFGMPVLEAMQCGVPAIVSNTSALPEIAGNAALVVDPRAPEEIGRAMALLYKDEDLRGRLIVDGLTRAKEFSWDRSAQTMRELLGSIHS